MHKFMLKFFGFLKSTAQFLKVLTIFSLLCLILYWTSNLANFNWTWLGFIAPLLDTFLEIGNMISNDSVKLFDAVFEYKYGIALVLFLILYYVAHGIQLGFIKLEELYGDGRRLVKKMQENAYNKTLEIQNRLDQEQIKNYQIYVAAYRKRKLTHLEADVDMVEQAKLMNKFLMEKTGIAPVKYGEGFLYSFSDFNSIDNVLPHFFKLIHSTAPLEYIICVQILPKNLTNEFDNMKKLIDLHLLNQITTLSDTVWRYKHNETHRYGLNQIGLYKKENSTFEAHEFIEI